MHLKRKFLSAYEPGLTERAVESGNKRVTKLLIAEEKSGWCIPIKTGHQLGGMQQEMILNT